MYQFLLIVKFNDACHFLDEWKNFLERIGVDPDNEEEVKGCMDDIRIWASYRGQTLARTGNMKIVSLKS